MRTSMSDEKDRERETHREGRGQGGVEGRGVR